MVKPLKDVKIGEEYEAIKGMPMKLKSIVYLFEDKDGTIMKLTFDRSNEDEKSSLIQENKGEPQ